MANRHLMWAAAVAALVTGAGFIVGLSDPAYYDPVTPFDYFGSVLNDLQLAVSGVALVIWSSVTPVRRAWLLIFGAGIGLLLWTVGNVLEEIMGLKTGEFVYFFGAVSGFGLTALAGIATLTAPTRWRWSGLVLLGLSLGIGFEAIPSWPVAWLALAVLLARRWFDEPAPQRG